MKLNSAVFYVTELNKSLDFYQNILGLELESKETDQFASLLFENAVRLGLRTKKLTEEREIPGHQTIFVDSNDAEADYGKFKNLNISMDELKEYEWGKVFNVFDPDGNKIEFIERK